MPTTKVRTTVALAENLLRAVDAAVKEGSVASRSEFIALALQNQLAAWRRQAIDASFAEMASDPIYQREALGIADEFGSADWESFRIAESDS